MAATPEKPAEVEKTSSTVAQKLNSQKSIERAVSLLDQDIQDPQVEPERLISEPKEVINEQIYRIFQTGDFKL